MTSIVHGYTIHNFLHKKHWCKVRCAGEDGIRSFRIRASIVMPEDIILKWSENGRYKTIWRVLSAYRVDKMYSMGRMEDVIRKGVVLTERLRAALGVAERNQ